MAVEADIFTALNTGFPELGGRIYPMVMPQDTNENCLTYRILAGSEDTCMGGEVYDTRYHVQVDVWADTYANSIALSTKVSTVLRTSFKISGLFAVDIYENYTLKFRRVVDFRIL